MGDRKGWRMGKGGERGVGDKEMFVYKKLMCQFSSHLLQLYAHTDCVGQFVSNQMCRPG